MLTRRPKKPKNSGCAGYTPKVEYYQDYKEEGNGKLSDIYFLVRLINVVFLWFSCREIVELFLRLVVVLIEGNSAFITLILFNMQIKGMNGDNYNVTGAGQGNLNTVLGAVGTYGALQSGALGNLLGGLGGCGNGWNRNGCMNACDTPVTRYEASMMNELSAKDSKIALLESNIYTDQKITDVYERLNTKINANKAEQDAVNMQQAVYNGTNTATIACIKNQVAELASLSQLVVPSRNVCDTGCGCNG